jgi:hypothetical protein
MRRNFLIMGQSNASGRGLLAQAPEYPNLSRMFLYGNDGIWKQAVEPIDSNVNQVDKISGDPNAGVGVGMAFANRICTLFPNDEVGLIPACLSSTYIISWRRTWTRTSLYGSAVNRAYEADGQGTLSGILWWLGENDAINRVYAMAHGERFANLMADFRQDLNKPLLPIVYARWNNLSQPNRPYWKTIRGQQEAFRMKNIAMASTDGVPFQADRVHCTTEGYVTIGIRMADAMATML